MPPSRPEPPDELLKDYQKPDDPLGQDGLLRQLTKAPVERALDGQLTRHLGSEKRGGAGGNSGDSRNGTAPETLRGKRGQVRVDVPRDRSAEFEPQLVEKDRTRSDGFDLDDQHDRVIEDDVAEGVVEPAIVPIGRGSVQALVPGLAEHQQAVDDADPGPERGAQSVRRLVRRASADEWPRLKLTQNQT